MRVGQWEQDRIVKLGKVGSGSDEEGWTRIQNRREIEGFWVGVGVAAGRM